MQPWPGTREVANAEVGPERNADRREDGEAGVDLIGLDPGEMRLVHASDLCECAK